MLRKKFTPEKKNYDHFNSGHSLLQRKKKENFDSTFKKYNYVKMKQILSYQIVKSFILSASPKLDENFFKTCLLNLGFNNQCYFNCLTSFPYISEELFTVGKTDIGMLKNLKTTINKM